MIIMYYEKAWIGLKEYVLDIIQDEETLSDYAQFAKEILVFIATEEICQKETERSEK